MSISSFPLLEPVPDKPTIQLSYLEIVTELPGGSEFINTTLFHILAAILLTACVFFFQVGQLLSLSRTDKFTATFLRLTG